MHITKFLKRHRFPASIISHAVWLYHRFNNSYRDVQEQMSYRGIILSHESVRCWCNKFAVYFQDVIRKRERKPTDKWHVDEMNIKIKSGLSDFCVSIISPFAQCCKLVSQSIAN